MRGTTPEDIARAFVKALAAGDIPAAMTFVAEDAVYALYLSGDVLPVAGETFGRDGIEAALRHLRAEFDYLLYRPFNFVSDGDGVRLQVEFMYRHRASGETLTGRFRLVMCVKGGLLVRADEYHDRAMVEAFLRLFGRPSARGE